LHNEALMITIRQIFG